MAGIASGMLDQVVLVVFLGLPPGACGGDLGEDGSLPLPAGIHLGFHALGGLPLSLRMEENGAAVRGALVIPLLVQGGGIVHAEEEMEQGFVAGLRRIEANLHGLGVSVMVLVGGVGGRTAGVAHFDGRSEEHTSE